MNEPIQDKAPKPPGIMPKRVQSWVIIGVALLMVLIIWLTGGKSAKTPAKSNAPQALPPTPSADVNEAKIADLQKRIRELQLEEQRAAILAQQNPPAGPFPREEQGMPGTEAYAPAQPAPPASDPIETERQTRAYKSLFASNVALSHRQGLQSSGEIDPDQSPARQKSRAANVAGVADLDPRPLVALGNTPQSESPQPAAPVQRPEPPNTPPPSSDVAKPGAFNRAEGKKYVIFEGTLLETLLMNRLDGQFSGPISCLLSNNIYSHDRQHLLIPAGSKILGETKKVDTFGQTRLAVLFHRLIMPDGYSVSLDQFKGLSQIGETALRDKVNNHYARIFGASLAIGALGAAAEVGTGNIFNQSSTDRMRQGLGASLAQSSERILDKFLNILPTVTIREGLRVKVYLSNDLVLPDYQSHTSPADL